MWQERLLPSEHAFPLNSSQNRLILTPFGTGIFKRSDSFVSVAILGIGPGQGVIGRGVADEGPQPRVCILLQSEEIVRGEGRAGPPFDPCMGRWVW